VLQWLSDTKMGAFGRVCCASVAVHIEIPHSMNSIERAGLLQLVVMAVQNFFAAVFK
jgi:hypothetical protein